MNENLDLDALEVPRLAVTFGGKKYTIAPAEFLRKVEDALAGRKDYTISEAVAAISKASGIPDLDADRASKLRAAAEDLFGRTEESKKKRPTGAPSPGSTGSRGRKPKS